MMKFLFPVLFFSLFILAGCKENVPVSTTPLDAALVPTTAKAISLIVYNENCWVEQDKVFYIGVCSNATPEWQKVWLEVVPYDAAGKPLTISNSASAIVSTFSDALPPSGRTSFFATWPLANFSGKPASFKVKNIMATQPAPGPILVSPMSNGMKLFAPSAPGKTDMVEAAWQVSSSVSNPLDMTASNPRIEVLVYDTEGKLWLTTLINPADPAVKDIFKFDSYSPLRPTENREFILTIGYQALPKALQEKKIGKVEIFPFEARL